MALDLLPGTSEDVDLECRYERLPLSPLLTSATTRSLKDLLKPGVREELWRLLSTYRDACAEVLTKPEDSDDDDTTTGTAQCRFSDGRLLTKHEEILGGVYVLLDASDLLDTNLGKRGRTRGQVRQHEADRFRLLTIFAAAAFVTLTEKWFNMTEPLSVALPTVSNLDPLDLRSYGRLVHDEWLDSRMPLLDHVCAICGRLLHPSTNVHGAPTDVGIPGPACQIRGPYSTWDWLPLLLLLWSKQTIAKSMPAVFHFDETTRALSLKGDASSAPWLHFVVRARTPAKTRPPAPTKRVRAKRGNTDKIIRHDALHGRRMELDTEKPWWYCTSCHAYWLPKGHNKGEPTFTTDERIPMRNYLEGYFTRWHVDMGFPYLREQLQRLYPDLSTLPSVADALEWQRRYLQWAAMLRESEQSKFVKARTPAQLALAEDVDREGDWLRSKELELSLIHI